MNTTLIDIQSDKKEVTYQTEDGDKRQMSYDKLILSPGNSMVAPGFLDMSLENVTHFAGPDAAEYLRKRLNESKKTVVIGGGYIGIEAVSSFNKAGVDVTVIDMQDRLLPVSLDKEFTDVIQADLEKRGVKVQTGEGVKELMSENGKVTGVKTDKGEYPADTVIVALGMRPNTQWLEGILELDERGFVVVDKHQQTSVPDVYAAGDSSTIEYAPTGKQFPIGLVPVARRTAIVAAKNALGDTSYTSKTFVGSSGLRLFDYYFASTGLKDANASHYDGEVASHYVEEKIYVDFVKEDDNKVMMKIHYDANTERILGGQLMAKNHDITPAINTLAVAIQANWTLEELAHADFFFQPDLNRPWNYLNYLAMSARGEVYGADELLF